MRNVDDNKELVRRYYEQVVTTGDVGRLDEFVHPDYVEYYRGVRYPVGLEGARAHILGVLQTYTDFALFVTQQIAEGEWVVSCIDMHGTHSGAWMNMKPTGKRMETTGVNVDRVVDGLIIEHGGAANMLEPLLEIGALKISNPVDSSQTAKQADRADNTPRFR